MSPTAGKVVDIRPAKGKLGILLPGMGAVATTFMAGVEAIRRGLSKPIGSLTQKGTIRLGKRTDARTPLISEFVPLAGSRTRLRRLICSPTTPTRRRWMRVVLSKEAPSAS